MNPVTFTRSERTALEDVTLYTNEYVLLTTVGLESPSYD